MIDSSTALVLAISIIFFAGIYNRNRKWNPLPPGPKGLPILGNILDLPQSRPWETFANWGDIYGGLVHVTAFGKSMVIINDPEIALEMLEQKGRIYCDRPTLVIAGDLVGWGVGLPLLPADRYGPWSEARRHYAQYIGSRTKVAKSLGDLLHDGARRFVKGLLVTPDNWSRHIRMFSTSTALMFSYGYKLEREDDAVLDAVVTAVNEFSQLTVNGAYLVDLFPILKYVPAWVPGAGWKRKIPAFKAHLDKMVDVPFEWSKAQLKSGNENRSFVHASLTSNHGMTPDEIQRLAVTASTFYAGGTDTTFSAIQAFFLAMVLFPEAQAKAQAEIDAIVGSGRLPTLRDRPRLPYVEALYWEVLRYYVFVPLSIPHAVREDDIHNGYFIPRGAIVLPNVWRFMKDKRKYKNPDSFSPERFLSSNGNLPEEDPRGLLFGFGRRACPGRHLGDAGLWIAVASVLASFSLSPSIKNGKPVRPNPQVPDGTITRLESFECEIKVRSDSIERIISSDQRVVVYSESAIL